jgi:hypothetical protein
MHVLPVHVHRMVVFSAWGSARLHTTLDVGLPKHLPVEEGLKNIGSPSRPNKAVGRVADRCAWDHTSRSAIFEQMQPMVWARGGGYRRECLCECRVRAGRGFDAIRTFGFTGSVLSSAAGSPRSKSHWSATSQLPHKRAMERDNPDSGLRRCMAAFPALCLPSIRSDIAQPRAAPTHAKWGRALCRNFQHGGDSYPRAARLEPFCQRCNLPIYGGAFVCP